MTKEELKAHGLNDSITHVDFMIGTPDLSIVGTTHDGREVRYLSTETLPSDPNKFQTKENWLWITKREPPIRTC